TTIRSGSAEVQIVGMDPDEFPILPTIEENRKFQMSSALLKSMIKQTVMAASTNESMAILTGVQWTMTDGTLRFIATDRHRLAFRQVRLDVDHDLQFDHI